MKNTNIIKRSVAGVLITAVAVCAFGCSKTSISRKDVDRAFREASKEYGLEDLDWESIYDSDTRKLGYSSKTAQGDDAVALFYSKVGLVFDIPKSDMPEIKEMELFYLSGDEIVYGHYIIFKNEEDCEEYCDMFCDFWEAETGEEKGFNCFTYVSDNRIEAVYQDGTTLIWFTEIIRETPEMLPYIYKKLGLSFPEN